MVRWICSLMVVAWTLSPTAAVAQQLFNTSPISSGKGMSLQVDTRWIAGSSYRPVSVRLTPTLPLTDTRTFDVRFRVRSWYGRERRFEVAQTLDVPPGRAPVTGTLSVPEFASWQNYDVEVFENGFPIEKLSQMGIAFNNNVEVLEGVPNMLIVGVQSIDTSPLVTALKAQALMMQYSSSSGGFGGGRLSAITAGSTPTEQLITVLRRKIEHLPARWIDLSSLDVISLSMAELDQLVQHQPGRWKAVREWTAAGGNLWVYDASEDWSELPNIEAALSLKANSDGFDPAGRGWVLPDRSKFRDDLESGFENTDYQPTPDYLEDPVALLFDDMTLKAAKPRLAAPLNDFATRAVGLGQVVAFTSPKLFEQTAADQRDVVDLWRWRVNTIGADRLLWVRRHGLSTRRENTDFWNFLVPGVGLVPVSAFRVLITLFMVAIGPLNYFWLRRKGRLHLLLVIVPIAAAVITGTLFGYAVTSDGFDVRTRARSLTHIDQRNRHAVCWSRLSYYAGLAPSGGLTFPEDTAVVPIGPAGADGDRSPPNRYLRWQEGQQILVSGWLPSRTATQFLTVRSRASEHGIDVLTTGNPPQIRNRLGSNIKLLIVNNGDGKLLAARSVAASSTTSLQPADADRDIAELHRLVQSQVMAIPQGLDPQQYNVFGMRSYNYYMRWNSGLNDASFSNSRLEENLNHVWMFGKARQTPADCVTSDRWYIAVVDRSPEVLFGTEPVKEEASLHVIVGEF